MLGLRNLLPLLALSLGQGASAFVYNTFDGEGSPSCHNVTEVHNATSVDEIASLVKDAKERGLRVRAAAQGHHWYDAQCSDEETMIIRTEFVNGIEQFELEDGAESGSVVIEAGTTFLEYAWFPSSLAVDERVTRHA